MKRAIVLSGGGSKGAYQIGVWRALKKLKISYVFTIFFIIRFVRYKGVCEYD